jgi:hypothetical protein
MAIVYVEPAPRINLRWIVRLRWGAVAGQAVTILLARRLLHQPLPVGELLAVVGLLAAANLAMQIWLWRGANPTDRACGLNLFGDVVELTAVLALSALGWRTLLPSSPAPDHRRRDPADAVGGRARHRLRLAFTPLDLLPEGPLGGEDVAFLHLRAAGSRSWSRPPSSPPSRCA